MTRKHAVGVAGAAVLVAVALWATVEIGGGSSGAGSGSSPVLARPTSQPFDNAGVCPKATDPVLPADAGCVTAVATDLDGDGATDRFSVFARIDGGGRPTSWEALAVIGGRPTPAVEVPTGQGVPYVYPRVLAAYDMNGDGRSEVFVKLSAILYHGGGQQILGLYDVVGGRIHPVDVRGQSDPLVFHVGGIGGYGDGGLCTRRDGHPVFLLRHIQRRAPLDWQSRERTYRWVGQGTLALTGLARGTQPGSVYINDPRVHAFYQLRCGPLLAP